MRNLTRAEYTKLLLATEFFKKDKRRYLFGDCGTMARHLNDLVGGKLRVYGLGYRYKGTMYVHHVFVKCGNKYLDGNGVSSLRQVEEHWKSYMRSVLPYKNHNYPEISVVRLHLRNVKYNCLGSPGEYWCYLGEPQIMATRRMEIELQLNAWLRSRMRRTRQKLHLMLLLMKLAGERNANKKQNVEKEVYIPRRKRA